MARVMTSISRPYFQEVRVGEEYLGRVEITYSGERTFALGIRLHQNTALELEGLTAAQLRTIASDILDIVGE